MVPIAIYMDGVPYSLTDSVVGFWVVNLVTEARHLFMVVRKRFTCKCGCRGWCTFWPIFQFIHWNLEAMARGVCPAKRADGEDFRACEKGLREKAGEPMPMKYACIHLQGDWMEFCERLALPSWQSAMRPCFFCNCFGENRDEIAGLSPVSMPWLANEDQDFEDACVRCERRVAVTAEIQNRLTPLLEYDKKQAGSYGRSLKEDVPELLLLKGDRLEPSTVLPDVGMFGTLRIDPALPITVIFWRVGEETLARHRNPILDPALGVSVVRSIAIDTLHTLHLGVFKSWVKVVLWKLLLSD